jgi:signal transduction histidine kinase
MKKGAAKLPIQKSAVLAELYQIGLDLVSNLDITSLLQSIVASARSVLRADIVVCYLYDQDTNSYALVQEIGTLQAPRLDRIPRPNGLTMSIVRSLNPLFSNDLQSEETPYKDSPYAKAEGINSVLGLPLKVGNEIVGVLYINYRKPNMITPTVFRNAELLANQASIAVNNARLFQRLSEREIAMSKILEIERRISESIAGSSDIQSGSIVKMVLDEIARLACELTNADCAAIYPYDSAREEYYDLENIGTWGLHTPLMASDKPRSTGSISSCVMRKGLIVLNDIEKESSEILRSKFIDREAIKSFVGVSVRAQDANLASLYVSFRAPHRFTSEEINIIKLFANQVSVALQIARLLEREQKARSNLEMLELLNKIGGALAHRTIGIVGTIPIEAHMIRRELEKLQSENPNIEQSLNRIESDSQRLMEMATSLRRLPDLIAPAEFADINEMVESVLNSVAKSSMVVRKRIAQELPRVSVPPQIREVFDNIIRNAMQVMPDGGELIVSTLQSGEHIEVSVTDTGPGISQDKLPKIFELFYSQNKKGLGFGLWWSRTLMRRIGGDILVKSDLGRGSTFTVIIPVLTSPVENKR